MKRKFNNTNNQLLCWGRNTVLSMLEAQPDICSSIQISSSARGEAIERIRETAGRYAIPVEMVSSERLELLCNDDNHQGVAGLLKTSPVKSLEEFLSWQLKDQDKSLLVMLDHIQDPHNMGAVIRSAESAGAEGVIYPDRRSASINGTVLKVSAGAAFRIPLLQVVNLSRSLDTLKKKGYWIIGLDQAGHDTIWTSPLPARMVLVLGSEGKGLSRLVRENCDELRRVPMKGSTGSLNVSVASAIGIFEWLRCHG